jgi:hypothetical protein
MVEKLSRLIKQYPTFYTSKRKAIIFTIFMLSLYFLFYIITKQIYYSVIKIDSYIFIMKEYFFAFYCISTLPIFFFFFFKFNICTKFWNNTEKPHLIDYLYFGIICLFLFLSFEQSDLNITAVHGKALLDMVWRGMNILGFYNYNQGWANYLLPQYILFGIWSIPVKFAYMIMGLQSIGINEILRINGLTLWWYKLLPTLFYIGSAFIIYKICIQLNFDKNKAKWASFIFLIFPMAVFSQFIFGQYDSIGVFFELIMIYFFLKRKILIASLFCMIAITFKVFPIFIFIPILLLFEKKIWKIIGYTGIAFTGYLFFNLLFYGSGTFNTSKNFNNGMFNRLLAVGINTSFGVVAFFLLVFIFSCVFAYFINLKDKNELIIKKYIMYIPLFVYSSFFSFVLFHPQWVLVLVPYLVINIFLNKNTKGMMFITTGAFIGFLFTIFNMPFWRNNVDASMINLGIFPKIYGFFNGDANLINSGDPILIYRYNSNGEGFKSLNRLVSFNGLIPSGVYFTLFVSMLFVNLILSFPSKKNIIKSKETIQLPFTTERDVVWINGLLILLFSIPSLLLFYSQGYKDVTFKEYISKLQLPNNIEVLEKSVYDIVSVDVINNGIFLKCGTQDPQINIPIQEGIEQFEGHPFVEITYTNTKDGTLQIYYDYGYGFSEKNSSRCNITVNDNETTVQIPIIGWIKKKKLVGLRIDPPNGTEFIIKDIKFITQKINKVKK